MTGSHSDAAATLCFCYFCYHCYFYYFFFFLSAEPVPVVKRTSCQLEVINQHRKSLILNRFSTGPCDFCTFLPIKCKSRGFRHYCWPFVPSLSSSRWRSPPAHDAQRLHRGRTQTNSESPLGLWLQPVERWLGCLPFSPGTKKNFLVSQVEPQNVTLIR